MSRLLIVKINSQIVTITLPSKASVIQKQYSKKTTSPHDKDWHLSHPLALSSHATTFLFTGCLSYNSHQLSFPFCFPPFLFLFPCIYWLFSSFPNFSTYIFLFLLASIFVLSYVNFSIFPFLSVILFLVYLFYYDSFYHRFKLYTFWKKRKNKRD